jgi:hypothetical protein
VEQPDRAAQTRDSSPSASENPLVQMRQGPLHRSMPNLAGKGKSSAGSGEGGARGCGQAHRGGGEASPERLRTPPFVHGGHSWMERGARCVWFCGFNV